MRMRLGEHVAVIGEKGSGKTTLMNYIRNAFERSIVFYCKPDEKQLYGRQGYFYRSAEDLITALNNLRYTKKYRNRIIMIDDIMSFVDSSKGEYPDAIRFFILTGRSSKCSMLLGLHYAKRFPPMLRNEIDHFFIFKPTLLGEQAIKDLFGERVLMLLSHLDKYACLYVSNTERATKLCKPVPVKIKKVDEDRGVELW